MILTFKYRIKDATVGKYLDRHSRSVNFVWNYCCEIQRKVEVYYKAGAPKHWVCSDCGCSHDRDVNAAQNILRVGAERRPPVEEIPALLGRGRR